MIIFVDWDNTCVEETPYNSIRAPLKLKPNAREALMSLKKAGHKLILWSARYSPALTENPELDICVRSGIKRVSRTQWEAARALNRARVDQMIAFVSQALPGVFDAIDDGRGGKSPYADLFLDDRAFRLGEGLHEVDWKWIQDTYGEHTNGPKRQEVTATKTGTGRKEAGKAGK